MSEGLCELDSCGKPDEESVECHPPSSTAIPAPFPSTLPPSLSSSLLLTFIDSIIISVSPSPSQIQDPTPVSASIPCSISPPTSQILECSSVSVPFSLIPYVQSSNLFTCVDLIQARIAKLASNSLLHFFLGRLSRRLLLLRKSCHNPPLLLRKFPPTFQNYFLS